LRGIYEELDDAVVSHQLLVDSVDEEKSEAWRRAAPEGTGHDQQATKKREISHIRKPTTSQERSRKIKAGLLRSK
jgi:hypothetical protein